MNLSKTHSPQEVFQAII